jgi:hypothetical protein
MEQNYYPLVQHSAIPSGTFFFYPLGRTLPPMQTVYETRRQRLEMLIKKHSAIADLNEALGWARTDSRISRIRNANARTDRDGKVFQMGDAMAREIEVALDLAEGWMDTPPSYADLTDNPNDPISKALDLLQAMEPEARYQAVRLLGALAEPPVANGTTGH